jgi:integrase
MGKLTVAKIRNAKPAYDGNGKAKAVRLSDGEGLQLLVKPSGGKSWVLRVQVRGKSRDIGLGSVDQDGLGREAFGQQDPLGALSLMQRTSLTLAEAREKSAALRKLAKAGADPILERDKERKSVPNFAEASNAAYKALKEGWSSKTSKAFLSSLQKHANPKLGPLRVNEIGASEIVLALDPIWNHKPVMARKVRSRIGQVLAFSKARGWRSEALPEAREMRSGLSRQAAGGHFEAMPYADCPGFFLSEWGKELSSSRAAMLFAMLTLNRSGSVRQATWEQVNLDAREWKSPAEIMKKGRAHDVALSDAAIALLDRFVPDRKLRVGLIFPGARGARLSDMSLTKALRQAGRTETVHGWRSSFRDWAAERMPEIPILVAKLAISHKVGDATDQAYLRTDMLEMRRKLFDGWGYFVAPSLSNAAANAVPLYKSV